MDQLRLTVRLLGKPEEAELWHIASEEARKCIYDFPESTGVELEVVCGDYLKGGGHGAAVDLVRQLLAFNPAERIRSAVALAHPWLAEVRLCGAEEEGSEYEEYEEYEAAPKVRVAFEDIDSAELTSSRFEAMVFQETHEFHATRRRGLTR